MTCSNAQACWAIRLLQRRYIPAPGAPTPRPGRTPAPEAGPPRPPGFVTGCACTPTPAAPRPAPGSTPAPEAGPPTPPAPTPGARVRPAPAAPKPAPGATPAPDAGPPIPPGLGRAIAAPQAAMARATPITTCPARFWMRCKVETNGLPLLLAGFVLAEALRLSNWRLYPLLALPLCCGAPTRRFAGQLW